MTHCSRSAKGNQKTMLRKRQIKETALQKFKTRLDTSLKWELTHERITEVDERKWFRMMLNENSKIALRTSEQMKNRSTIKLPQFDPNFFSPDEIECRYPGCHKKFPQDPLYSLEEVRKEDLYLCLDHQRIVTNLIHEQCAEKNVEVKFETFNAKEFAGYTSLIGKLEKAHMHLLGGDVKMSKPLKSTLSELFLNVRNFLFITNALLNPAPENLRIILPAILTILTNVVERIENREYVENLVFLVRNIMKIFLHFFGVLYTWVSVEVRNPYGDIGGGVGCLVGACVSGWAFGPVSSMITLGAGIGCVSGALVGAGIYKLEKERKEHRQEVEGYQAYREFVEQSRPNRYAIAARQTNENRTRVITVFLYRFEGDVYGNLYISLPNFRYFY